MSCVRVCLRNLRSASFASQSLTQALAAANRILPTSRLLQVPRWGPAGSPATSVAMQQPPSPKRFAQGVNLSDRVAVRANVDRTMFKVSGSSARFPGLSGGARSSLCRVNHTCPGLFRTPPSPPAHSTTPVTRPSLCCAPGGRRVVWASRQPPVLMSAPSCNLHGSGGRHPAVARPWPSPRHARP